MDPGPGNGAGIAFNLRVDDVYSFAAREDRMDERPIRGEDFDPDWSKIALLGCLALCGMIGALVVIPVIILLWKAALRS